jgi:CheY-like chemotaxis protein
MPEAFEFLLESADEGELCTRLEERLAADARRRRRPSTAPVLVIGEDDLWRRRVVGLLHAREHRTQEIASAREALARLRSERVAAVVLDLLLPRPGVLTVLAAMTSDDDLAQIPVLLIGPSMLSPVQQRDLYLAVTAWVGESGRPVDELGERVRRALERSTAAFAPARAS